MEAGASVLAGVAQRQGPAEGLLDVPLSELAEEVAQGRRLPADRPRVGPGGRLLAARPALPER